MTILRYKLNNDLMKNLQGRFRHVHTDGQVMIIGRTARALAFKLLAGIDIKVNDCDYTVIGGQSYCKDYNVARCGKNRVEVEDDAPHASISDYMSSRDFTINQVAVDSKGNLFVTKNALKDIRSGVINTVDNRSVTPREAVRACRFTMEYNFELSSVIRDYVDRHNVGMMKLEAVWHRYSLQFNLYNYILHLWGWDIV